MSLHRILCRRTLLAPGVAVLGFGNLKNPTHCAGSVRSYGSASFVVPEVPKKVTVYQYKICPFCCRVKAYLDYLKIPYETVEVNPLTKGELKFSKDYKKVPIVVFDGVQVNDSSPILNHITDNLVVKDVAMKAGLFTEDTEKWSEWSEKTLAVMLYPNITRSMQVSLKFGGVLEGGYYSIVDI